MRSSYAWKTRDTDNFYQTVEFCSSHQIKHQRMYDCQSRNFSFATLWLKIYHITQKGTYHKTLYLDNICSIIYCHWYVSIQWHLQPHNRINNSHNEKITINKNISYFSILSKAINFNWQTHLNSPQWNNVTQSLWCTHHSDYINV